MIVFLAIACQACAREDLAPKAAFQRGADLLEKRHFKEAVPYLKQAEKEFPTAPSVLWNLGLANAQLGNASEALHYWRRYRKAKPQDWRGIAMLIQAFQATGDAQARDRELLALYERRAKREDPDLSNAREFCRDRFVVAHHRLLALEYFDPQRGNRLYFYRFSIGDDKTGEETSYISLESDDWTTEVARELGEISSSQLVYTVERYEGAKHSTYAFFNERPSYDVVRQLVVDILQGKATPVSASAPEKGAVKMEFRPSARGQLATGDR
jgi:tetratricopeptide (TPR) repeat protein